MSKRRGKRRGDLGAPVVRSVSAPRAPDPPSPESWPLLACYAPRPEVWQASGFGTVFVARRRPSGGEVWLLAVLSLGAGGFPRLGVRSDAPAGAHLDMVADLRALDRFPAAVEAPESVAAAYLYGNCALALDATPEWGWLPRMRKALRLLPRPAGEPAQWRARLVGPDGLTPAGLVRAVAAFAQLRPLAENKDPIVFTTVRAGLEPRAAQRIRQQLLAREDQPWFRPAGKNAGNVILRWVRPYAGGLKAPPGRRLQAVFADPDDPGAVTVRSFTSDGMQIMGDITFGDGWAEVQAVTLSRAAVLMSALAVAAGAPLDVLSADWQPVLPEDLRGAGGAAGG